MNSTVPYRVWFSTHDVSPLGTDETLGDDTMFQTHYNVFIVFNKLHVILYDISDKHTQPANLLYELWLAAGLQLRWRIVSGPFDQHFCP